MLKKYIKFYSFSIVIIGFLLLLFAQKMYFTYEAKDNFIIFKSISQEFTQKKGNIIINIQDIELKNKENININIEDGSLKISIINTNYRTCLKYGVDYIHSDFTTLLINDFLFTRSVPVTRDIILDKCNKTFNNITLTQTKDRRWK